MECRCIVEGSETDVGIPCASVPGGNSREKRIAIAHLTVDSFATLVGSSKGFACKMVGDADVMLPHRPDQRGLFQSPLGHQLRRWRRRPCEDHDRPSH
eukprot:4431643-Pyramimonas_sp.AAC.1